MSGCRLIVVEDDDSFRTVIVKELSRVGYEIRAYSEAQGVCEEVRTFDPKVVLLDLKLKSSSGLDLLREIRRMDPDIQVLMLTGHGSVKEAVQAIRFGAYDFLTKPVQLEVLEQVLERAAEKYDLLWENRRLRRVATTSQGFEPILGKSPEVVELRRLVGRIARVDSNVLILGENGTGKELVSRSLHALSARSEKPFVVVNCAAIPESLVESELFGHERGSFTGAERKHVGLFEAAQEGSLLLDEIGDLPMSVQPALLRAVQFGEIRPVGSQRTRTVDVRVFAATNRDLEKEVEESRFREDLFYRLSALQVEIPPLRARGDDIALLARTFLINECEATGRTHIFDDSAIGRLCTYEWPGNVRELQNAVTRICVLAEDELITEDVLSDLVFRRKRVRKGDLPTLYLEDLEKIAIITSLERFNGDKKRASRELGVSLKTLYNKLRKYDLRERFIQQQSGGQMGASGLGPRA